MNILIIGASGMVGHVLLKSFRDANVNVIGIARRKWDKDIISLDLKNWEEVKCFLLNNQVDSIFNCSGILVNESNFNKAQAVYINSLFPHLLIDLFRNSSTKVIHLSTGGVFSGSDKWYFEDSIVSPPTFYGITKAAGEFNNVKDLVVRSDFWGPDCKNGGTGIFNWFLNQNKEVKAYEKVYFNGISNIEFSKMALKLIDYSGIIHLGTSDVISKAELLRKIKNNFRLDNIVIISDTSIHKKIYLKSKMKIPEINNYDNMISDVYQYMINHEQFYKNIYTSFYECLYEYNKKMYKNS